MHPPRSPRRGRESARRQRGEQDARRSPHLRYAPGGRVERTLGDARNGGPPPIPNTPPRVSNEKIKRRQQVGGAAPSGQGQRAPAGHKGRDPGITPTPACQPPAGVLAAELPAPRGSGAAVPSRTHCCIPCPRRVCTPRSSDSCPAPVGPPPARVARAGAAKRPAPAPQPCCGHLAERVTRWRRPGRAPAGGAGGGEGVGRAARRAAPGKV